MHRHESSVEPKDGSDHPDRVQVLSGESQAAPLRTCTFENNCGVEHVIGIGRRHRNRCIRLAGCQLREPVPLRKPRSAESGRRARASG